jgi:hypothetical protein
MFNEQVFWKENFTDGEAKGGFFIRAVDLKKFLESVEAADHGGEVVGLRFSDNNLEVIVKERE